MPDRRSRCAELNVSPWPRMAVGRDAISTPKCVSTGRAMNQHPRRKLRARFAALLYYAVLASVVYHGIGLFHEPYAHLLSSTETSHLDRICAELRQMPATDYYRTPQSCYVPASRKAEILFELMEGGVLVANNPEAMDLIGPEYLAWEGRMEDPAYLKLIEVELEETIQDYLGGNDVHVTIELEKVPREVAMLAGHNMKNESRQ